MVEAMQQIYPFGKKGHLLFNLTLWKRYTWRTETVRNCLKDRWNEKETLMEWASILTGPSLTEQTRGHWLSQNPGYRLPCDIFPGSLSGSYCFPPSQDQCKDTKRMSAAVRVTGLLGVSEAPKKLSPSPFAPYPEPLAYFPLWKCAPGHFMMKLPSCCPSNIRTIENPQIWSNSHDKWGS